MLAPAGVALLAGPAMPPARSAGLWASLGAFPHISLIRAIGELSDGEWRQSNRYGTVARPSLGGRELRLRWTPGWVRRAERSAPS